MHKINNTICSIYIDKDETFHYCATFRGEMNIMIMMMSAVIMLIIFIWCHLGHLSV